MFRSSLLALLAAAVLAAPAAADPPTATPVQTVAVGDAQLGYRDINPTAGNPLVLIAGYGLTMTEWDPVFVERLARDRRVITFDNRGMGNSTGPTKGLTIGRMADDTAGLIRALRLRRPDVLGYSMGGYIAQMLALDHPGRVGRLVLAATDPGSPKAVEPTQEVIDALDSPEFSGESILPYLFPADRLSAGREWMERIAAQPSLTAADFDTPESTMQAQARANGWRWYGRGRGAYARLPKLRAKVLIAHGAEDVVVPPGNAKLLDRRIRRATMRTYPDAGHGFLFQDPAAKATAIARWLDRG
jgi:pimeloyl-ACP methyl ester carboxylesterase